MRELEHLTRLFIAYQFVRAEVCTVKWSREDDDDGERGDDFGGSMAVANGGARGAVPTPSPQSKNHHGRLLGMESYDYLWKIITWIR